MGRNPTAISIAYKPLLRTENPCVGGSNPPLPISQQLDNKEVTVINSKNKTPKNQELVSGLFFESENDQDLKLILQHWPELPDHIKAAVKALIQIHNKENK